MSYYQGSLDGLCGLYACINALNNVSGMKLTQEDCEKLFKSGVYFINSKGRNSLRDAMLNGLEIDAVGDLLEHLAARVESHKDKRLVVKEMNADVDLKGFWNALELCIMAKGAAIVSLEQPFPHWSCVVGVGPKRLYFADSGSLRQLNRANCTVGAAPAGKRTNVFNPSEVLSVFLQENWDAFVNGDDRKNGG